MHSRDTHNPPVNITNKIGFILLRQGDLTTPRTFCLFRIILYLTTVPVIMADGFEILLGWTEVTVPWVLDGKDYQIVRKYTHISQLFSSSCGYISVW